MPTSVDRRELHFKFGRASEAWEHLEHQQRFLPSLKNCGVSLEATMAGSKDDKKSGSAKGGKSGQGSTKK